MWVTAAELSPVKGQPGPRQGANTADQDAAKQAHIAITLKRETLATIAVRPLQSGRALPACRLSVQTITSPSHHALQHELRSALKGSCPTVTYSLTAAQTADGDTLSVLCAKVHITPDC